MYCTERQVQYAEHTRPTPQKHRCGPAAALNTSFRQRIADFITSSKRTRRMPFIQVNMKLGLNLSKPTISRAMKKEGIFRRLARKKPPISEKNRLLRLAFAHQHRYWTRLQWDVILGRMKPGSRMADIRAHGYLGELAKNTKQIV